MLAPKDLKLKKGAQVCLIKNLSDTLVNGVIGQIIDFEVPNNPNTRSLEALDTKSDIKLRIFEKFYKDSKDDEHREKVPIVKWLLPTGQLVISTLPRAKFDVESNAGTMATRTQVGRLTIHDL